MGNITPIYEPIDIELDREMVAEETNLDVLTEWLTDLRDTESELYTMIRSMQLADEGAGIPMSRKLGYIRIACNWVRRRIEELGGEVDDDVLGSKYRRMKHNLTCANQQLEKRNKQLKELRARVAELEAR